LIIKKNKRKEDYEKGSRDIEIWIPPYQVRGRLIMSGMIVVFFTIVCVAAMRD
jgi:hypothetical protein